MSEEFGIEVRHEGAAVIVAPRGELDVATVKRLRSELELHASASILVLDLRGLSFMDSVGVSLVVEQERRAGREGFEFRVVRGPQSIQRLFEVTGLIEHLHWSEDPSERASRAGAARS